MARSASVPQHASSANGRWIRGRVALDGSVVIDGRYSETLTEVVQDVPAHHEELLAPSTGLAVTASASS
jgi:hypothetical protein